MFDGVAETHDQASLQFKQLCVSTIQSPARHYGHVSKQCGYLEYHTPLNAKCLPNTLSLAIILLTTPPTLFLLRY